jgi:hypothetical protein
MWVRELVVVLDFGAIVAAFGAATWKALDWWERRR